MSGSMSGQRMATPGAFRVLTWHLVAYKRFWKANVLSSVVQPLLYMLGLGVGVGALVDRNTGSSEVLGGASYAAFVAPGLLITTAMALGAMESLWPVMGGLKWSRGYHGIIATSLTPRDIVFGHGVWMVVRCGLASAAVAAALACFSTTRSWGLVPGVLVAVWVGLAFAMPIMAFSINVEMDSSFPAVQRFVVIPLFLFGGAFYPLTQLPAAVGWVARATPLWHGVVVARGFTQGSAPLLPTLGHLAYIGLWTAAGTWVAVRRMQRKLYQ